MASPATGDAPNGIATPTGGPSQPGNATTSTPPSSSAANAAAPAGTTPGATGGGDATSTTVTAPAQQQSASSSAAPTVQPNTSLNDSGLTKRPRDARLLHMVLAHLGVSAYQERVPLQLMDFAYRYTAGVLSDAVAISAETTTAATGGKGGAPGNPQRAAGGAGGAGGDENNVSLAAIRSAIASRLNYQFNPVLPKEFLLELAQEKNRVSLPRPEREYGVRLPPERYCFTGAGWGLKEEWDSDVEDDGDEQGKDGINGDDRMEGVQEEGMDEDEDEFEDVMGVGEDREMADA
ncbi:putative transcription initiation factor 31kd protein [Lasiodiplodia theobromae]|uniref:Transcription initiation factor TFIID subunit 9 n=1 Tax=Lasiodiplodia theobromae TaxID=45133 RepID=A0A5N5DGK9_9PEZI|nr:Transcription initiation factor 31kd protein [Lasiodiplodia theobromae]KAB2576114.1 Transcription initiation factor TFIID subunit 9 [Lasiodiplodia theobromae]KAF4545660.1 Transcription initiation factor 31kd protein [Lasiodiplodia theobromae]KAF9636211.1 putative transcription initiation factor 31kd protein [Lasiodiplodia theobromae]